MCVAGNEARTITGHATALGTTVEDEKAIASHFDFSRIAVMKHLAGLAISEKEGRTRQLWFNPVPIQQVYDRWTSQYGSFWAERLTDVKGRVEARSGRRKRKSA